MCVCVCVRWQKTYIDKLYVYGGITISTEKKQQIQAHINKWYSGSGGGGVGATAAI